MKGGICMKKLIFGLGLLLSGVIGFVGWCIAVTQTVKPGARSVVFGCFRNVEWIVLAIFAIMAIVGLFIAIKEVTQDEKSL